MGKQGAIDYLITTLRRITTAVQVAPFLYAFFYIFALALYLFASEDVIRMADTLLYVSPVVVACNLVNSGILKLCRWHKTACLLPLFPQINLFVDRYIYEFSVTFEIVHIATIIAMTVLLLVAAYDVFIK